MSNHDRVGGRVAMEDVRRILIIDDSEADRFEYRQLLQGHAPGWDVQEVETGADGLSAATADRFDCIIVDHYLPDMTSLDFIERLGAATDADVPPVPVTVLTGRDDREIAQSILHSGAQDYLVKGTLTGPGIVRTLENAIEKHAIRWELERKRAAVEMRTWQLERTQEQLRAKVSELATATRAKDQFVAVMSHEMRTPLNAVLGYAELLEVGVKGELPPSAKEYVDRIRIGGRHLLELINDVLDLSRADAAEIDLVLSAVNPVAVAEEVTYLLEREASRKNIELRLETPGAPVARARADIRRFRQVLTNLVANAIKFTDTGEVTLSVEEMDGFVAVHVVDTGVGIPEDHLPLIFERFFQVDGSFTRRRGGIGLGLAIAQRLARLMGGDIHVESEEGVGSTFTLILPLADGELSEATDGELPERGQRLASAEGAAVPVPEPASVPVLIFSENEDALRALAQHVAPAVQLYWTTRSRDVRRLAVEREVDLVVLDISAVNGAAWMAAQALQNVPELASTAILLLPTMPEAAMEQGAAIDLGWVSLVPKPFTEKQLTRAVSHAADSGNGNAAPRADEIEVLVVDDDPESRHVARRFLQRAGLRVREATDGETALVAMRYRAPDVVVLDLMMPVLDGFGVLAAIRADAHLAGVPVVVLSAKSLTPAERRFLGRSAVRILQKGEHRLGDVAALVMRAAQGARS